MAQVYIMGKSALNSRRWSTQRILTVIDLMFCLFCTSSVPVQAFVVQSNNHQNDYLNCLQHRIEERSKNKRSLSFDTRGTSRISHHSRSRFSINPLKMTTLSESSPFYDYLMQRGFDMEVIRQSMNLGKSTTGRRGMIAQRDGITAGDILLKVPFSTAAIILEQDGNEKDILKYYDKNRNEPDFNDTHDTLGHGRRAWNFWERVVHGGRRNELLPKDKMKNPHQPYLDLLPTRTAGVSAGTSIPDEHHHYYENFDPTPDLWTLDQVKALELPEIIEEVTMRQHELQNTYELNELDIPTLDDFLWAHWIVTSRSFSIFTPNPESETKDLKDLIENSDEDRVDNFIIQCVMLPWIDMINHDSVASNVELDLLEESDDETSARTMLVLKARKSISIGEELLLAYGTTEDESMDILMNYGFVPSKNPIDIEVFEDTFDFTDDEEDNQEKMPIDVWSTTLIEDLQALESLQDVSLEAAHRSDLGNAILQTILRFRIKIKRAVNGQDRIE